MRIQATSSGFPRPLHPGSWPGLHLGALSWLHLAELAGRKDKNNLNSQRFILCRCVSDTGHWEIEGQKRNIQQVPTKESWGGNINIGITIISVISLLHTHISSHSSAALPSLWHPPRGAALPFCLLSVILRESLRLFTSDLNTLLV